MKKIKNKSLKILALSKDVKGYSPRDIKKLKKEIGNQAFEELFSVKSNGGQYNYSPKTATERAMNWS
jgi:hypothetical protein